MSEKEEMLGELERRRKQSEAAKENKAEEIRRYLVWEHLTRNQKEVAKRVIAGNYELVNDSGWGFLDKFMIFLKEVGFMRVLEMTGEGYERRMIMVSQLLMTYQMKILLGISSMNQVPEMLFKDIGLLKLLGFTAKIIKGGPCKRSRKKGKKVKGPMHKDTLADALDRFSTEEVEQIINESIKVLDKGGFIEDDIYIVDPTDIETTEKCKGCGRKTVEEEHINGRTGETICIPKTKYGFKLLVIRGSKKRNRGGGKNRTDTGERKELYPEFD